MWQSPESHDYSPVTAGLGLSNVDHVVLLRIPAVNSVSYMKRKIKKWVSVDRGSKYTVEAIWFSEFVMLVHQGSAWIQPYGVEKSCIDYSHTFK